jgi:hypothetical protein
LPRRDDARKASATAGRPLPGPDRSSGIFVSLLLVWTIACGERPTTLIRVVGEPVDGATRLSLVPAPGVRINAVLKPALKLPDGTIYRFDSPQVTTDSAYFTAPPEVTVTGRARGRVVASVCPQGLAVCRVVELEL